MSPNEQISPTSCLVPSIRNEPEQSKDNDDDQLQQQVLPHGYVIHYDTGARSSEGFGSHARGSLFPLIHIAATLKFKPVFCNNGLSENIARDYPHLDVASFFGLVVVQQQEEEQQQQGATSCCNSNNNNNNKSSSSISSTLESTCGTVLNFSTWTDSKIGSACGDAVLLGELLKDYLYSSKTRDNDDESNNNGQGATQSPSAAANMKRPILVCLTGSFRYMNPTRLVLDYLQNQSLQWRQTSTRLRPCGDDNVDKIKIVAHVRVPEDFCPQFWKDSNSIDKVLNVLNLMEASLYRILRDGNHHDDHDKTSIAPAAPAFLLQEHADISIVTEQAFSDKDEKLVLNRFPTTRIHRGTQQTLLQDLQQLATSDVLIPSSSHLSALAGYLTHGVIFLSDPSRLEYFQPHVDLLQPPACSIVFATKDNPKFRKEMQKLLLHFRRFKQQGTFSAPAANSALSSLDVDGSSKKEEETSDNHRHYVYSSACSLKT